MHGDIRFLVTFDQRDPEIPARIVRAVADAVRDNWRTPGHGGPPVPKRVFPARRLLEEWPSPIWTERANLMTGQPFTVEEEFEFSPFTSYPVRLQLYRWRKRIQATVTVADRAFHAAFEGSYFYHDVEAALECDGETKWYDLSKEYFAARDYGLDRYPDLASHFDAVVFAVASAGPNHGPLDIGDYHAQDHVGEHSQLPPPPKMPPHEPIRPQGWQSP